MKFTNNELIEIQNALVSLQYEILEDPYIFTEERIKIINSIDTKIKTKRKKKKEI